MDISSSVEVFLPLYGVLTRVNDGGNCGVLVFDVDAAAVADSVVAVVAVEPVVERVGVGICRGVAVIQLSAAVCGGQQSVGMIIRVRSAPAVSWWWVFAAVGVGVGEVDGADCVRTLR